MLYKITNPDHRFTNRLGQNLAGIGFSVTNRSSRTHVFQPLLGGFTAVKRSHGVVQFTDYIGKASGYGNCYDPPLIDPDGTDPIRYRVKPGHTIKDLEMCWLMPPKQILAKVKFADNNASRNAVIKIPRAFEISVINSGPFPCYDCPPPQLGSVGARPRR